MLLSLGLMSVALGLFLLLLILYDDEVDILISLLLLSHVVRVIHGLLGICARVDDLLVTLQSSDLILKLHDLSLMMLISLLHILGADL